MEKMHTWFRRGRVIAVADGVGGWRDLGVDAGEFSRELMKHAEEYVNETGIPVPKFVLQSAYNNIEAVGTSTICVVGINRGRLEACNLETWFLHFPSWWKRKSRLFTRVRDGL